jgi:hypothetical protein
MPRPNPPPPAMKPSLLPFNLGDQQQRCLAKVLGHRTLPALAAGAIAEAIACYKATETGSPDTTVGKHPRGTRRVEKGRGARLRPSCETPRRRAERCRLYNPRDPSAAGEGRARRSARSTPNTLAGRRLKSGEVTSTSARPDVKGTVAALLRRAP